MSILQKILELIIEAVRAIPSSLFNLTGGNILATALVCALMFLCILLGRASQPTQRVHEDGRRFYQLEWRNLVVILLFMVLCVAGLSAVSGLEAVEPQALIEQASTRF